MKKNLTFIGILFCFFILVTFSIPEARTIILTGAGNILLSLNTQNLTDDGSGNVTVEVDTLESEVSLGSTSVLFRNHSGIIQLSEDTGATWSGITAPSLLTSPTTFQNTSGILLWNNSQLEFSNDAGTSSFPIGEGGNVLYGLSDSGEGTLASSSKDVLNIITPFFHTDWHIRSLVLKDVAADAAVLFELNSVTYSKIRLQIGINTSEQPYITIGTDFATVPATTTYTCTDALLSAGITQAIDTTTQFLIEFDYDGTNDELVCCVSGQCGVAITAATDFDQLYDDSGGDTSNTETISIGDGGDWILYYLSFAQVAHYTASTYYYPDGKPELCYQCTAEWNFTEKTGSTLADSVGTIDLTVVDGVWGQ